MALKKFQMTKNKFQTNFNFSITKIQNSRSQKQNRTQKKSQLTKSKFQTDFNSQIQNTKQPGAIQKSVTFEKVILLV